MTKVRYPQAGVGPYPGSRQYPIPGYGSTPYPGTAERVIPAGYGGAPRAPSLSGTPYTTTPSIWSVCTDFAANGTATVLPDTRMSERAV